jgi:hypothetical protein
MTTVREELVSFIHSALRKTGKTKFQDMGMKFVNEVLTEIQGNKFMSTSLSKKFSGFDRTCVSPGIQADMKVIVEKMMNLIITEIVMEE